jgi:hypothetical protein
MKNTKERSAEKAYRVKRTAEITGLKPDTVYAIIRGDRENEEVFTTYMELKERDDLLLQEIKKLVPFN